MLKDALKPIFFGLCFSAALSSMVLANRAMAALPVRTETQAQKTDLPLSKRTALKDPKNRIQSHFQIPSELRRRVEFWFDVYTKYGETEHVIHHSDHPWIVFDVVDVKPILQGPGHKWTKHHRAEAEVKRRRLAVVKNLIALSKLNSEKRLTPEQRRLRSALMALPGSTKRVARVASRNVRVQLGQRDFFETGLHVAEKYLPKMEDIFESHGLPKELTRLPLVESSFNEKAVSKVGASGIWQLMPAMGRILLGKHQSLDQRNSPIVATFAAAQILKQNYRSLKSWPLAITAYNHGPSGLRKAIRQLKTTNLSEIITRFRGDSFGFATANFYSEFLAALHAEMYKEEVFNYSPTARPLHVEVIALPHSMRIHHLAKRTGLSPEELRTHNPELKAKGISKRTLLPKGYKVILPASKAQVFQGELQEVRTKSGKKLKSSS